MALKELCKVFGRKRDFQQYERCTLLCFQLSNFSSSKALYQRLDEPIKYSATKASKMKASDTFHVKPNPAVLPIERYVVIGSVIVLMLYVVFLREENVIDERLGGTFRYEEDDEIKLLNALLHAKLKGLKTDEIEKKLKEVRSQK